MARRVKKSRLAVFTLALVFWIGWGLIVFFLEPATIKNLWLPHAYLPFFLTLFGALFFSLAVIFMNSRHSLIISSGAILFLILRLFGLGNLLNAILISGSLLALELYFDKR